MNWIDYRTTCPLKFSRNNISGLPEKIVVNLSHQEQDLAFKAALAIQANPYRVEEQELFIINAKKIIDVLSNQTRSHILSEINSGFGAVLVSGLPTDQWLPDTPSRGGSLDPEYKKTFVNEAMLIALGSISGAEPFNFRQEGRGSAPLIDNIVPVPNLHAQKGAGGYENNFPFHCESAWHRKRPDYLVLLGVREAPDAKTIVFSSETFKSSDWPLTNLSIDGWFKLRAPELYSQMEEVGIPMGTANYSLNSPIQKNGSDIKLNINFNGTDCLHDKAVEWLKRLEEYIERRAFGTVIAPGNALVLNNDLTCHTRTGYSPIFDGQSRWFIRGYFKRDLWSHRRSEEQYIDEEDLSDLMKLGWMTPQGYLTAEFSKYVYSPEQTKALTGEKARLASIAFQFTPVEGTRII